MPFSPRAEHWVQAFSQPCTAQRQVPKAGIADLPSQTSQPGSAQLLTVIVGPCLLCGSFQDCWSASRARCPETFASLPSAGQRLNTPPAALSPVLVPLRFLPHLKTPANKPGGTCASIQVLPSRLLYRLLRLAQEILVPSQSLCSSRTECGGCSKCSDHRGCCRSRSDYGQEREREYDSRERERDREAYIQRHRHEKGFDEREHRSSSRSSRHYEDDHGDRRHRSHHDDRWVPLPSCLACSVDWAGHAAAAAALVAHRVFLLS